MQVHLDREHDHRWHLLDLAWRPLAGDGIARLPPAPASLERMCEAAAELARPFDFVRVDFYEVDGQPRFGEMTFYPGSGLDPFPSLALDRRLGEAWTGVCP